MSAIKLQCSGCGKSTDYPRELDRYIPASVVRIESNFCDRCDNGDFDCETWFDADGNEVSQDVHALTPTHPGAA